MITDRPDIVVGVTCHVPGFCPVFIDLDAPVPIVGIPDVGYDLIGIVINELLDVVVGKTFIGAVHADLKILVIACGLVIPVTDSGSIDFIYAISIRCTVLVDR